MAKNCTSIQKSLAWCQGTPELPGVKRRIYYSAKSNIVAFPQLPRDDIGRPTSSVLTGDFTLAADTKWHFIDILPDKSQLTSDAQGESPSQTQLNKLTAVHPGVGADATATAAYINNTDNAFIVEEINDAVLCRAFAVNAWYRVHIRRIFPVNNCCIIPWRIATYLSRLASNSTISASISESMEAMACCSSTQRGIDTV